jgi:hypothetical protein
LPKTRRHQGLVVMMMMMPQPSKRFNNFCTLGISDFLGQFVEILRSMDQELKIVARWKVHVMIMMM